ncbi:hypothetical protein ACFL2I_05040 [Candidatus Omnitrophota bacterium]
MRCKIFGYWRVTVLLVFAACFAFICNRALDASVSSATSGKDISQSRDIFIDALDRDATRQASIAGLMATLDSPMDIRRYASVLTSLLSNKSLDFLSYREIIYFLNWVEFKQAYSDDTEWRRLYTPETVENLSNIFSHPTLYEEDNIRYYNAAGRVLRRISMLYPEKCGNFIRDIIFSPLLKVDSSKRLMLEQRLVLGRNSSFHRVLLETLTFRIRYIVKREALADFLSVWSSDEFHDSIAAAGKVSHYSRYSFAMNLIDFYKDYDINSLDSYRDSAVIKLICGILKDCLNDQVIIGPGKHIFIYSSNDGWFFRQSCALREAAEKKGAVAELYMNINDFSIALKRAKDQGINPKDIVIFFAAHGNDSLSAFEGNYVSKITPQMVAGGLMALAGEKASLDGLIFLTTACYGFDLTADIQTELRTQGLRGFPIIITQANRGERTWSGYIQDLLQRKAKAAQITIADYFDIGERFWVKWRQTTWRFVDPTMRVPFSEQAKARLRGLIRNSKYAKDIDFSPVPMLQVF